MPMPEIRELSAGDEAAWQRNLVQAYRRGDRGDGTHRWPVDASIRRFGLFEESDLVAQFALRSYEIFFDGKRVPMGGIAAVACLPLARGKGHVEALLWHGLEQMREVGQPLSTLHAFLVGLYRPMGWEWVGSQRGYTLPLAHLPRDLEPRGVRVAGPADVDVLQALYEADAARYRGMLLRAPSWWRERLEAKTGHTHYFYLYERARPEGYLYLQMQEPARVRELIAASPEAYRALLGVLRRHRAQLANVTWTAPPDDPLWHIAAHWEVEVAWRPPFSGRVVDLPAAVALLSPAEALAGECVLQVEDPLTPWNTGVWRIAAEGGAARAERTTRTATAACDIGAFSQLLFGDPDAGALRRAGRLSVTDERGFAFLRALCPPALCWMNDYF
jgi:predicted acetyltransferase